MTKRKFKIGDVVEDMSEGGEVFIISNQEELDMVNEWNIVYHVLSKKEIVRGISQLKREVIRMEKQVEILNNYLEKLKS